MGRNEIKLRRKKMSSGNIQRYRNYSAIMNQHERDVKLKRTVRVFVYFLIIAALLILFVIVTRLEKKAEVKKTEIERTSLLVYPDH